MTVAPTAEHPRARRVTRPADPIRYGSLTKLPSRRSFAISSRKETVERARDLGLLERPAHPGWIDAGVMANGQTSRTMGGVTTYRIVVEGELSDRFVATFEGMQLERGAGETFLTGRISDQAQLQGLHARTADLGLSLRSFGPLTADPVTGAGADGGSVP